MTGRYPHFRHWMLLLTVVAVTACASGGGAAAATAGGATRSASYDRERLSRAELEERASSNMFDVVSTLRSQWLVSPTSSLSGRGSSTGPVVYMNGRRLGDVAELKSVAAAAVESATYLSASKAQSKYGLAEALPVIELVGRSRNL